MELHAAAAVAARPLALDAPTLVHAFQYTAAQRPDEVALRIPGDAVSLTWREYAAARGADRGRARGAGGRARRRRRADAAQPARVQPRRHRGPASRRDAVLGLQHLDARAGRPAVRERRQPRGGDRAALPRRRARGRGAAEIVLVEELEQLEERGGEQLPLHRDLAGGAALGPRHDHLHVGHDRPAQGRRADARQRDGAVRGERGALPADARRPGDVLPAQRPRRRPLDVATGGRR